MNPYTTPPERIEALHAIRDRYKGDTGPAQRERLLAVLRELGPATTFELSRYADIYYPPSRKHELVGEGHKIQTTRRTTATESGERHSLGVYALVNDSRAGE